MEQILLGLDIGHFAFLVIGLTLMGFGLFAMFTRQRKLQSPWSSNTSPIDFILFQIYGTRSLKGKKAIIGGLVYILIGAVIVYGALKSKFML